MLVGWTREGVVNMGEEAERPVGSYFGRTHRQVRWTIAVPEISPKRHH
jgi:hypothetical protein